MLWVGDNQISSKYKSNGHAKGAFTVVQGNKHQCAKGEIIKIYAFLQEK